MELISKVTKVSFPQNNNEHAVFEFTLLIPSAVRLVILNLPKPKPFLTF